MEKIEIANNDINNFMRIVDVISSSSCSSSDVLSLYLGSVNMRDVSKIITKAFMASINTSNKRANSLDISKYLEMLIIHEVMPNKIMLNVAALNMRSAFSSEILNKRHLPFHGANITRIIARISVI